MQVVCQCLKQPARLRAHFCDIAGIDPLHAEGAITYTQAMLGQQLNQTCAMQLGQNHAG